VSDFIPVKMIVKDGSKIVFVNKDKILAIGRESDKITLLLTDSFKMDIEPWGPIKDLIAKVEQDYRGHMTEK